MFEIPLGTGKRPSLGTKGWIEWEGVAAASISCDFRIRLMFSL